MHANVERLKSLLDTLRATEKQEKQDGWTIQEIVGHLIDSASNNHQRFLRYIEHETLNYPNYDQFEFVKRAQYHSMDFRILVDLWYHYNILIDHIIQHIPVEHLSSTVKISEDMSFTLDGLIEHYYGHMNIHEQQIRRIFELDQI